MADSACPRLRAMMGSRPGPSGRGPVRGPWARRGWSAAMGGGLAAAFGWFAFPAWLLARRRTSAELERRYSWRPWLWSSALVSGHTAQPDLASGVRISGSWISAARR